MPGPVPPELWSLGTAGSPARVRLAAEKLATLDGLIDRNLNEQILATYFCRYRSVGFLNIIRAFKLWCYIFGFELFKDYMSNVKVTIEEVHAYFAEYTYSRFPYNLHDDPLGEFFDMLFKVHDDWKFYETTRQDRKFDCDSMYNPNWFVDGMTAIHNSL